jgi:hypothetical protein
MLSLDQIEFLSNVAHRLILQDCHHATPVLTHSIPLIALNARTYGAVKVLAITITLNAPVPYTDVAFIEETQLTPHWNTVE